MSLYGSRDQKKWAAKRRAQLALKHAWERIDYMEDVVKKELEELDRGTKKLSHGGFDLEDAHKALEP